MTFGHAAPFRGIGEAYSFLHLQPQLYKPADGLGPRETPKVRGSDVSANRGGPTHVCRVKTCVGPCTLGEFGATWRCKSRAFPPLPAGLFLGARNDLAL